jgi:succinate dehydrogenase membrane anchor subunit
MAEMRTPLHRVLGLGSAHAGTTHFWRQRLTAIANVPLVIAFVIVVISVAGRPYPEVVAVLSSPLVAILLVLMILSIVVHMRIGMQVIVEDYVHGTVVRPLALIASTFFAAAVGAIAVFAILKLAFGG